MTESEESRQKRMDHVFAGFYKQAYAAVIIAIVIMFYVTSSNYRHSTDSSPAPQYQYKTEITST